MNQEPHTPGLSEKVALVTGASRGLGRAIARRLSREGAAVAIHYRRNAAAAESLASEIEAENRRALLVQGDVSDPSQARSIVEQVARKLGPVAILVNNAAASYPAELDDFNDSEMDVMWRTNVIGPVHIIQSVVPAMKDQHFGRIINISSIAALGTAAQGTTFYAATKAALSILTRRFAMDLGPHGITVNAVAPGFIPTDMGLGGKTGEKAKAHVEDFAARAMVRRVGTPEDIANAVAFLASPDSSFITAQILTVDGGRLDYMLLSI
ncbi:MAG TPA: glucose 1-dehydrogenase [Terriglobia bacterium]|nr:glucose 1-dehydrogenase [Terriglobia bacterium]